MQQMEWVLSYETGKTVPQFEEGIEKPNFIGAQETQGLRGMLVLNDSKRVVASIVFPFNARPIAFTRNIVSLIGNEQVEEKAFFFGFQQTINGKNVKHILCFESDGSLTLSADDGRGDL